MNAFIERAVLVQIDQPMVLSELPNGAQLARALLRIGAVSAARLPELAISDLFAQGYCAKPLTLDLLQTEDLSIRPLLKKIKSAKYIETTLLNSLQKEDDLLSLLQQKSAVVRAGYIQGLGGLKQLPIRNRLDPRREQPAVLELQGAFWFFLKAPQQVWARLEGVDALPLDGETLPLAGTLSMPMGGDRYCLQTAASALAIHSPAAVFRIRSDACLKRRLLPGSVLTAEDHLAPISVHTNSAVMPYLFKF